MSDRSFPFFLLAAGALVAACGDDSTETSTTQSTGGPTSSSVAATTSQAASGSGGAGTGGAGGVDATSSSDASSSDTSSSDTSSATGTGGQGAGGGPTEEEVVASEICQAICTCIGACGDENLDACLTNVVSTIEMADAAGCSDEVDAYTDCYRTSIACEGGIVDDSACDVQFDALETCLG